MKKSRREPGTSPGGCLKSLLSFIFVNQRVKLSKFYFAGFGKYTAINGKCCLVLFGLIVK